MIKKEIAEIKKQFKPDTCTIDRICGCYVDGEKNKKAIFREAFLSLPEEDMHKYLEIFKKTLSGTLGRNLLNMDFPLETEKEGGPQHFLLQLRNSELKEDSLLEQFFDRIIEGYYYSGNYLILLIHAGYDIPGYASDGTRMEDASDEVFRYVVCSICPVKLSKPGLCFDDSTQSFSNSLGQWVVEMPDIGFMFPSFNDRHTDLHSILYYSKNAEELHYDIAGTLLGCELPLSAKTQKETFHELICETLGDRCEYDTVKNIHERLNSLLEESKDEPLPLALDQKQVKNILEDSGASFEQLEDFEKRFSQTAGPNASLLAMNIANTKKFEVTTPDVIVRVNPERSDLVTTRIIDGQRCLVIPLDDNVKVNGISVHASVTESEPGE